MSPELWLILFISGTAVLMDFLMEKVVNSFICAGLLAGLILQSHMWHIKGIWVYVTGVLMPFFLLLPLFYFHMLGAGDIKLFCVLGGILGLESIFKIMICSFVLGAVLSLAFLISCGNLKERCVYFFHYMYQYLITKEERPYRKRGKQAENIHFTVPIFLGVMLYAGGFY